MGNERLKVALLGTGLFARDVYAKTLASLASRVEVASVWSRTEAAARDYCTKLAPGAVPAWGDEGLASILDDASVRLLVLVLPVQAMLPVVRAAVGRGKHVIQEKPVGPDTSAALEAIKWYRSLPAAQRSLWMFAGWMAASDVVASARCSVCATPCRLIIPC